MGNLEDKEKHSRRRKRNVIAKVLRDPGEKRGAFSLRVINPKRQEYKRVKLSVNNIEETDEE